MGRQPVRAGRFLTVIGILNFHISLPAGPLSRNRRGGCAAWAGKPAFPCLPGGGPRRWRRFAVLRPHTEDDMPLTRSARNADVPLRTVQRWLARFRQDGVAGLARTERTDQSRRRLPDDLVRAVEGMALARPPPSAAAVRRQLAELSRERGWPVPAPRTVRALIAGLDPAMRTLAHEGPAAYRDRYELIHRHRAARPNAVWQCDHIELDVLVVGSNARPLRPWRTLVLDNHSRDRGIQPADRRALGAEHSARVASGDLAERRSGLADLRHSGCALRRSRYRLYQHARRAGRRGPAYAPCALRRRPSPGARQDRALLRLAEHQTARRTSGPAGKRRPHHAAAPDARRTRRRDPRLRNRALQRTSASRHERVPERSMEGGRLAAAHARPARRPRRAAGHGCSPARRGPRLS